MSQDPTLPARFRFISPSSPPVEHVGRCLAFDVEAQREVMVTWMRARPADAKRFQTECALARELLVSGLAKVFTFEAPAGDDRVFMASEAAPWVNLRQVLQGPRLPVPVAARVFGALYQTVMAMHGRGLVHGAIDPRNILVAPDGGVSLDGYAPAPAQVALQDLGAEVSRLRYEPPERGRVRAVLPGGDVYSLGLVLHELLTGVPLLGAGDRANLTVSQARLQEHLDGRAFPYFEPAVRRLMTAMLQADPRRRPPSALPLAPQVEEAFAAVADRAEDCPDLRRAIYYPTRETRAMLEVRARQCLDDDRPLAAATLLQFASSQSPGAAERGRYAEILCDCLWETLLERPHIEKSLIAFQVLKAATRVMPDPLQVLAQRRLGELAAADGRARGGPALDDEQIERLKRSLRSQPRNQALLLTLAVYRPGLRPESATGRDELKAGVCRRLDLPAAALIYGAACLGRGDDVPALELIGPLLEDASRDAGLRPQETASTASWLGAEVFGEVLSGELEPYVAGSGAGLGPRPGAPRLGAVEAAELVEHLSETLEGRRLPEAAEALGKLYDHGVAQLEQHYPAICELLRRFLWMAVLPDGPVRGLDDALEVVLRVARGLGLHALVPLTERMLVAAIPEGERPARLERLLAESPESIPILQAASRLAASRGDDSQWIRHIETAGFTYLGVGEIALASRMFSALRNLDPDSPAARKGQQKLLELGERMTEASRALDAHEAREARAEPHEALAALEPLLEKYPFFGPLTARAAALHQAVGNTAQAAAMYLHLAKRSFYREEESAAREHLRQVLACDHDHDEAMLSLLVLDPPPDDAPGEIWKLKVWLCGREGLGQAAVFHARKRLTGGATDLPILDVILSLTSAAGQDRSPVMTEAAFIAWEAGQLDLARKYLDSAYRAAKDKESLLDSLLAKPGIEEIFPRIELLRMRTDPGMALIPRGDDEDAKTEFRAPDPPADPDARGRTRPAGRRFFSDSEPGLVDP